MFKRLFGTFLVIGLILIINCIICSAEDIKFEKVKSWTLPFDIQKNPHITWMCLGTLDNGYYFFDGDNVLIKTDEFQKVTMKKTMETDFGIKGGAPKIITSENGAIICGRTSDYKNSLVIKIDEAGNVVWKNKFDNISFSQVFCDSDGNLVFCGSALIKPENSESINDALVIKMSYGGGILWKKTYGGTSNENFNCGMLLSDGNYLFCGDTESVDGDLEGKSVQWRDGFTIKTDKEGNIIYTSVLGYDDSVELISGCIEDAGGYIFVGSSTIDNKKDSMGCFYKTDFQGNIIWKKRLDENHTWVNAINKMSDCEFIAYSKIGIKFYSLNSQGEIKFVEKNNNHFAGVSNNGGFIETDIKGTLTERKLSLGAVSISLNKNIAKKDPNEIQVIADNSVIAFDQPPALVEGRTLVPMRKIFESLGAEVKWDDKNKTVIGTKGSCEIKLTIGQSEMYYNNTKQTIDVPAQIINGRTLVPIRVIATALNAQVNWDGDNKIIRITSVFNNYSFEKTDDNIPNIELYKKAFADVRFTEGMGLINNGINIEIDGKKTVYSSISSLFNGSPIYQIELNKDTKTTSFYRINPSYDIISYLFSGKSINNFIKLDKENILLSAKSKVYVLARSGNEFSLYTTEILEPEYNFKGKTFLRVNMPYDKAYRGAILITPDGQFAGMDSSLYSNLDGNLLFYSLAEMNNMNITPTSGMGDFVSGVLGAENFPDSIINNKFVYNEKEPKDEKYDTGMSILPNSVVTGRFDKDEDTDVFRYGISRIMKFDVDLTLTTEDGSDLPISYADNIEIWGEQKYSNETTFGTIVQNNGKWSYKFSFTPSFGDLTEKDTIDYAFSTPDSYFVKIKLKKQVSNREKIIYKLTTSFVNPLFPKVK